MRVDLEKLEALLNAAKFELTFGDENDAYAELNIGDSGCRLSMRREGTYPGESGMSRAQMLAFMHLVQESINALPSLITELRETQWRPIETAPKDGRWILLATKFGVYKTRWALNDFTGYTPSMCWCTSCEDCFNDSYDLLWMPIPENPLEEKQ